MKLWHSLDKLHKSLDFHLMKSSSIDFTTATPLKTQANAREIIANRIIMNIHIKKMF